MTAITVAKHRVQSIDILRGAIMLIMALDHVRDFFHHGGPSADPTDMLTTTPILFFTRWITHFCAPTFVFLSGISANIAGTRRSKKDLSLFLIKRGIWLLFVEVAFITLALTFNPFYNVIILQVIWAIGGSMVLLGLLVWLPVEAIGAIGLLIFFGHDILDFAKLPQTGAAALIIKVFFTAFGTVVPLGHSYIFLLYALIPWTGIMLIGFAFGTLYTAAYEPARRKKILILSGLVLLAFFLILRATNLYGDPSPWTTQRNWGHTLLSFFNVSKYPPSLMYDCMTLSVALLVLAFTENIKNKFTDILTIYGSVPFFYYVLHFYLIRIFTVFSFFAQGYKTSQIVTPGAFSLFTPSGGGYNLGVVYLVWLTVITILYIPCRWFSKYKKSHKQWWLSYL